MFWKKWAKVCPLNLMPDVSEQMLLGLQTLPVTLYHSVFYFVILGIWSPLIHVISISMYSFHPFTLSFIQLQLPPYSHKAWERQIKQEFKMYREHVIVWRVWRHLSLAPPVWLMCVCQLCCLQDHCRCFLPQNGKWILL